MEENEYNIPFELFQNEILKPISEHENYLISNMGRVWSIEREWWLISSLSGNYPTVYFDGKSHLVHRLVAQAFIPNPDNLPIVNHRDENKHNAHWENLEWCTQEYNMNYGTARQRAGENNTGIPNEEINKIALEKFQKEEDEWLGRKIFTDEYEEILKRYRFVSHKPGHIHDKRQVGIPTMLKILEESGLYIVIKNKKSLDKETKKVRRYFKIEKVKK